MSNQPDQVVLAEALAYLTRLVQDRRGSRRKLSIPLEMVIDDREWLANSPAGASDIRCELVREQRARRFVPALRAEGARIADEGSAEIYVSIPESPRHS